MDDPGRFSCSQHPAQISFASAVDSPSRCTASQSEIDGCCSSRLVMRNSGCKAAAPMHRCCRSRIRRCPGSPSTIRPPPTVSDADERRMNRSPQARPAVSSNGGLHRSFPRAAAVNRSGAMAGHHDVVPACKVNLTMSQRSFYRSQTLDFCEHAQSSE